MEVGTKDTEVRLGDLPGGGDSGESLVRDPNTQDASPVSSSFGFSVAPSESPLRPLPACFAKMQSPLLTPSSPLHRPGSEYLMPSVELVSQSLFSCFPLSRWLCGAHLSEKTCF